MSMKFIRDTYKVPAKRGMKVCLHGEMGRILSASNYLVILLDNNLPPFGLNVHPTDDMAYLLDDGTWFYTDVTQRTIDATKRYVHS